MNRGSLFSLVIVLIGGCVCFMGCSRDHYRLRADVDAYSRVVEKSGCTPWAVPGDYSVYPAPQSRLYDPTCVNDPCLPDPSPQLYDYQLPQLPERDLGRFQPEVNDLDPLADEGMIEALPPPPTGEMLPLGPGEELIHVEELPPVSIQSTSHPEPTDDQSADHSESPVKVVQFVPQTDPPQDEVATLDSLLDAEADSIKDEIAQESNGNRTDPQAPNLNDSQDDESNEEDVDSDAEIQANQVPLPQSYWEGIPPECLSRMFAFKSVRDEYERSYGAPPKPSQMDDSPKLALEDIVDLTLLNSRELQTQKELLFRVALVLTLERFEYQLKPSAGGNGSGLDWNHRRVDGDTVNTLFIPTAVQLDKMLYTGADVVGRFANDILLTFNGPQGFSANVASELLFDFSQSLFQRDVRLENLTQSERDVVYAARDFARFRKTLFVDQAGRYYSLIRQFRQIEIQCQNYFTLAREFNQRSIEIKYGMAARTELDQVEQQVITGRQSILSSCTSLENSLDDLKIEMGIPTEQPLNLDLAELNLLTLRDELAVNAELIKRTQTRINKEIQSESRSAFVILGGVAQLAEQMIDSLALRERLGEQSLDAAPLENRLINLRLEAADIDIAEDLGVLNEELQDEAPDSTKVVQRRRDVAQELLRKVEWQIRLVERLDENEPRLSQWNDQFELREQQLTDLENSFLQIIFREQSVNSDENPDDLNAAEQDLIRKTATLQSNLQAMADELDNTLVRTAATSDTGFDQRAIQYAEELISQSEKLRDGASGGLVPIDIDMDDAMMTALVQRFDLMNQRGELADTWRAIKYAADDLRSILNLNASQSIRTGIRNNRPFDFGFDNSRTTVNLTLDLPFNRRAQRNSFRASLFSYQQTLRNVMQLEDGIKLATRRDLRALKLNGQQYANDIAGAALASERVTGTELEVRGGFATSRDFLESQQAYVEAISGVAEDHINYIVGRLDLFLDLESLTVGDNGFWDDLYDEQQQPIPYYELPGYVRPGYDQLHPKLKYSDRIRRMQCVPSGAPMVHAARQAAEILPAESLSPIPTSPESPIPAIQSPAIEE